MVLYNFKKIQAVPSGKDFVDIALTKTQRKTPTVVHPGYAISRIRKFYMRKVKFTQQTLHDKLSQILTDFPVLDEIHPFYSDLMNVLYDKDHYKLALSQLSTGRHLIDNIAKDYVRLLKFGDSLYRCKQLKRSALGRMMKVVKKNTTSLAYLEQVRQHMARLPSIDPNTRTILVAGYPNVGKSSFVNKVTRANVEVQPYAFTTKSLFVGHMDYRYLRWQVIDTPGILDHPLEERNTIEMQSITALAHLRATVLYFIDISERCGYTIEEQCSLCEKIAPLFQGKPLVIVMTKVDLVDPNKLNIDDQKRIQALTQRDGVLLLTMSNVSEEGIATVKKAACEALLEQRTQTKLKGKRMLDVANRIHLAQPMKRDDKERPPVIPDSLDSREEAEARLAEFEMQKQMYHDMAMEYEGIDRRKRYLLDDEDWRFDKVPEIMDGKNVFDFWSDDLDEKLAALEREEILRLRKLEQELESKVEDGYDLSEEQQHKLDKIRAKRAMLIQRSRMTKTVQDNPIPRRYNVQGRTLSDIEQHLIDLGLDGKRAVDRIRERSTSRSRSRSRGASESRAGRKRTREEMSQERALSKTPKPGSGLKDLKSLEKAEKLADRAKKRFRAEGKLGESDRHIDTKRPKFLFTGKAGLGTKTIGR